MIDDISFKMISATVLRVVVLRDKLDDVRNWCREYIPSSYQIIEMHYTGQVFIEGVEATTLFKIWWG
jgi:hypothetical protein